MIVLKRIEAGDYATQDGHYRAMWYADAGWDGKGLWILYADGRPCDGFKTLRECREAIASAQKEICPC
jgi:hypothetical protein